MKLTSSVNFINILRTALALVDPESVKNTVKSSVSLFITLLGSMSVKAVRRMLMKLSPGVQTMNFTHTDTYTHPHTHIYTYTVIVIEED